jgi:hypothetical protein
VDNGTGNMQITGNNDTSIEERVKCCGKAQQPHVAKVSPNAPEHVVCTIFNAQIMEMTYGSFF